MCTASRALTAGCLALLAAIPAPASAANLDWLLPPLGNPCNRPVVTARTTYMPRFAAGTLTPQPVAAVPGTVAPGMAVPGAVGAGCAACAPSAGVSCVTPPVQYVPQACYRQVVRAVPVTTYHPVAVCDPCTGCAQVCYRPVTALVQSVQLVPYTTYRAVYAAPLVPGAGCAGWDAGYAAAPSLPAAPPAVYPSVPAGPAESIPGSPEAAPPGGAATFAQPAPNGATTLMRPPVPTPQPRGPLVPIPQARPTPAPEQPGPGINGPNGASYAPPPADPHGRTTARPVRVTVLDAAWRAARDESPAGQVANVNLP